MSGCGQLGNSTCTKDSSQSEPGLAAVVKFGIITQQRGLPCVNGSTWPTGLDSS